MTRLLARLKSPTPKRILTLDGGGVRGALTLGFLAKIESLLRERYGRDDLLLCDYFDLISGTSTGAIIATCLALGMSVEEVTQRYHQLAGRVFRRFKWNFWTAKYDERPLVEELSRVMGQKTLGDEALRTGLCLMLKRADTNSLWPLINHPEGKFFELNRNIRLGDAVRASTAAPTFFLPQFIEVGNRESGAFIDGAVSLAHNPAWHTFLVATRRGYPFRWPTGDDRLLLISVGTGRRIWREELRRLKRYWLPNWAREVPRMLIEDGNLQVQMILQCLSNSPTAISLDSEIGNLQGDLVTDKPLLHYLRYDLEFTSEAFSAIGIPLSPEKIAKLSDLAAAENIPLLALAAGKAAEQQVLRDHFPACFD